MNLKEKLDQDLKAAMKDKKEREVSVLRLLKHSISHKEKEKRYKIFTQKKGIEEEELEKESQLSDEEIVELIFSEIKKREEAILEFEKGRREDLVQKEREEIEVLKRYLPKQLTREEIESIAKEIIQKVGPNFGMVMKEIMQKVKGRAEGSLVAQIVKELISQQ